MRNLARLSGVYGNMLRLALLLIGSLAALAQAGWQQDPLNVAIENAWQARNEGRTADVVAARDQARALLASARLDSPHYQSWVQQVSSLYSSSGSNIQAREVLQSALARTAALGQTHPLYVGIETALGEAWVQDGNLLKALSYLEPAAAAQAVATPPAAAQQQQGGHAIGFVTTAGIFGRRGGSFNQAVYAYSRLVDLYRQLGRPDAVAAATAKVVTLAASDPVSLAQFYEQHQQYPEAASLYRKLAEQSTDAQAKAQAFQSLANVEERQSNFAEAADAMKQAIATLDSSQPDKRAQTIWMRQSLANEFLQASQTDQAEQVYSQLLQEFGSGPQAPQLLNSYASFLAQTNRAAEGQALLTGYLDQNAGLDPQLKAMILYGLSSLSRRQNNSKAAEAYQQQAQALQPRQPRPAGQINIGEDIQKTDAALKAHHLDEAFALAGRVLDTAPLATDWLQIQWFIPQTAQQFVANQQAAKGEQLFQRFLAMGESRQQDFPQVLVMAAQSYAQFLMVQKDRLSEVPNAIARFRNILEVQNGPDSATLLQSTRMKLTFESTHGQQQIKATARDLLEAQESLSGNTSEQYLRDLQIVARAYREMGDNEAAAGLLRQAVGISDLVSTPNNDWNRTQTRFEAAWALAGLKQFDEAETLAEEAVAIARADPRGQQLSSLLTQLDQIRRMKQPATASAQR